MFNVGLEQHSGLLPTVWDSALRMVRRHAVTILIRHSYSYERKMSNLLCDFALFVYKYDFMHSIATYLIYLLSVS